MTRRASRVPALSCLLLLCSLAAGAEGPITFGRVQTLAADGRLEEALAGTETLLARGDRSRPVRRTHADLLAWTGNLDRALVAYDELLKETPWDPELLLAVALVHKWQGDLPRAEREMADIVARCPECAEVVHQLALLREDPTLEAARARDVLAREPGNVEALRTVVRAAVAGEQFWEAEAALERGRGAVDEATLAPLRDEVRREKTVRLEARIAERGAALAAQPDDAALRRAQAEDLTALGRLDEAADHYAILGHVEPGGREARLQEAKLRSWTGDYRRALPLWEGQVAETPTDAAARVERARVLAWDGQLARAADGLGGFDVGAEAQSVLGDVARWDGSRRRAADHYHRALDAGLGEPGATEARRYLAEEERFTVVAPGFEFFEDNEDFRSFRYGLETVHEYDFATRIGARMTHADYHQDVSMTAERGALFLAHDWGLVRGLLLGGASGYSRGGGVVPAAGAQLEVTPAPEQAFGVGYDRYDLIDEVTTLRSARGDVLQGDRGRLWARQPLPYELGLSAWGSLARVTDGNNATTAGAVVRRRVWRRPRVTLALDTRYYGTADRSPRYWSPNRYITGGLGVEVEHELRRGIRVVGEGRGGYATEDGNDSAEVGYGVRLAVGVWPGWELLLGYRGGRTARSTGGSQGYASQAASLEVRYRVGSRMPWE